MRILDADPSCFHAPDAIGRIAELEDVAGEAFDGEVLVDGADDHIRRLQQHLEIGIVGDGTTRGDRREPRPAPPAQHIIDLVAMDQRPTPPSRCGEAVGEHVPQRHAVGSRH